MRKTLKYQHKKFSKILLTVLSAAAILIIAAQSGFSAPETAIPPVTQTPQQSLQTNSRNADSVQKQVQTNSEAAANTRQDDTKNAQQEKQETILKFIIAMAGVMLSSIIIFLGLTIYNKFFVNKSMFADNNADDALNTPKTVEEAVTFYIKRNKLC